MSKGNHENSSAAAYDALALLHIALFKLVGIHPRVEDEEPSSWRRRAKNWTSVGCCHAMSALYYTMHLGYGLRMLLEGRLEIDYVCDMLAVQGVSLRYLILYLQRRDLLELTVACRRLWRVFVRHEEELKIVREFARKTYYLRQFFLWSSFAAVVFYFVTAQVVRVPALEPNVTDRRVLPMKFYVEVQDEPWYTLVTALQVAMSCVICPVVVGIETVGPFLIMMACGYLRIVRERLTSMALCADQVVESPVAESVLVCVKFHQKILQFCDRINRFTRGLFMIQVSCTLYNMSLIGFTLLKSKEGVFKGISILVINVAQFFSCQWISEYLINESLAITDAAYSATTLGHHQFDSRANRMLLLMMLRAKKPVQLTAGGIIRLSLESFKNLFVDACSFFAMLRNFAS